jgi:AbrB family looped-hinge helix DNA binding protein
MTKLDITASGQVTLPADVLEHLGVGPGGEIEVEKLPSGRIQLRAAKEKEEISAVFGMLEREDGQHLSMAEMNRIVARGWAGK